MFAHDRLTGLILRHVRLKGTTSVGPRITARSFNHFISRTEPDSSVNGASASSSTSFTLAVKDNIATTALPTTCGSRILAGHLSPYEATIVTQLRARGAHVVGKTNLDEFGMGSHSTHSAHGAVRNSSPRLIRADDVETNPRSAGGSSGGSAVAVARGEADVALGTDTGGSVRLPAAYTGVVGFKPSYGMLSRYGVVPYAHSLDTVGLLAKEVRPIEDLLVGGGGRGRSNQPSEKKELPGLWAESDPQDPTSMPTSTRIRCAQQREGYVDGRTSWALKGLVFGLPLEYNIAELDSCIRDGWLSAAQTLERHGARVVPVSLPTTRQALSAYYVIAPAEASSNLAKYDGVRYGTRVDDDEAKAGAEGGASADSGVLYSRTRGAGFGAEVKRRILLGAYSLSSEAMDNHFIQAQRVRQLVRRDFDRVLALPNPLLDDPSSSANTQPFDLSDLPDDVPLADKRGPAQVDFLLCPTAPTLPPTLEAVRRQTPLDAYMNDVFTVPASLAGLPAVSVPMDVVPDTAAQGGDDDAPDFAGLQLIGQYWDDARLLGVADALMRALEAGEARK